MPIQFQAPFQINPYEQSPQQRSLAQLGQTLGGLGDEALKYGQWQKENARQNALLQIQQQQNQRAQTQFNLENFGNPEGQQAPMPGQTTAIDPRTQQPMSIDPSAWGGASQPGPQGAFPNSSMNNGGSMGPYPQQPPDTGYSPQGQSMSMPSGQGVDHTSHFQNWMAMGQPSSYDHPDYGGTGQNIGMQGQGRPQYNPDDPYGLGINQRQVGVAAYKQALDQQRAQAGARVLSKSPVATSIFGQTSPQDLALMGGNAPDILMKGAELQSSMNYRNAMLGNAQTKITNETQLPAQKEAATMYNDFTNTDTAATAAKQSLAQAQRNPAMFNTALFSVGKALGVTSRNPEMVVQAIAEGDPSLAGKVQEYIAKKGTGKLSPELLTGLNAMVDNAQQQNQNSFEQKAQAHIQQNAKYYGGEQQAQQALFPKYQFGGRSNAGGGRGNGGGAPQVPNPGQSGGGQQTVSVTTSDGQTLNIYASNLAAARKRDPGLKVNG